MVVEDSHGNTGISPGRRDEERSRVVCSDVSRSARSSFNDDSVRASSRRNTTWRDKGMRVPVRVACAPDPSGVGVLWAKDER